MDPSRYWASPA